MEEIIYDYSHIFITQDTLYILHKTLCIAHYTLHIMHCTLYITHYTLPIMHFALHTELCIMQYTLCIVHYAQIHKVIWNTLIGGISFGHNVVIWTRKSQNVATNMHVLPCGCLLVNVFCLYFCMAIFILFNPITIGALALFDPVGVQIETLILFDFSEIYPRTIKYICKKNYLRGKKILNLFKVIGVPKTPLPQPLSLIRTPSLKRVKEYVYLLLLFFFGLIIPIPFLLPAATVPQAPQTSLADNTTSKCKFEISLDKFNI